MEIVVHKGSQKQKQSKKPLIVATVSTTKKKQAKPKQAKGKKIWWDGQNYIGDSFPLKNYLTAPSVFGPCRIPRPGGCIKTGLGMDRSLVAITGSSTNLIQGFAMNAQFATNCGSTLTATTNATTLTVASAAVASQFPQSTNMDDVSFVAGEISISYLGSPLNATGEVIIGCASSDNISFSTATYNSLYYYPGFIKVPVASLIDTPLRCFAVKASPQADSFIATNTQVNDVMKPVVLSNGLTVGGVLNVEVTRTWEFRSTVANTLTVPYEIAGESLSKDLSAMQDTEAELGRLPCQVEASYSEYVREVAMGALGNLGLTWGPSLASMALGHLGNRHMARLRATGRGLI
jgi:hypothetical protein